jgi:sodium/bile acid cotransporter 7
MKLFRVLDPFTLTLVCTVLLATFFPARGGFVPFFEGLTTAAIALLFFMHGAKLSREAIIAGGSHWRLHLWVMCSTFILFPVLGVLFVWWSPVNVSQELYTGFLYLCILPATVQSAIAFTSLAGGNVAAAVCSASASSLLGIFLSPLLVGLLMNLHGADGSLEQVGKIMLQLLLPFVLGICHAGGRVHGWRVIRSGFRKPTRHPFCWSSIPRLAKPLLMGSGTR